MDDTNPYYNPEALDLVKVAEVDLEEPSYSFDILAVWSDDKGLYLGTDSGCSCPTPFEDYNGRESMTGPLTVDQAIEEAKSLKAAHYNPGYAPAEWAEFLAKVLESRIQPTGPNGEDVAGDAS